jgi:polyhydroxybutyrate depolymerase
MFHGYGATGATQETIVFRIATASDAHGFLYAYGDGTIDSAGKRFWNATDGCCNIDHSPVDDVAYFDAIVQDVSSKYAVDPKRVYAIGHSNGGFMAHRLACDRSTEIAAIVALAGDNYVDESKCNPTVPVSVLQVHGDADQTILYDGGATTTGPYPSAHDSVATWASKDGCTGALAPTGQMLDLDPGIAGDETRVNAYGGCPSGVDVQLWTIQGGPHIPTLNHPQWGEMVWAFLSAHSR